MGYCVNCGSSIPDDQNVCSMCYGDPFYGNDGYYQEWLERLEQEEYLKQQEIEEQIKRDNE